MPRSLRETEQVRVLPGRNHLLDCAIRNCETAIDDREAFAQFGLGIDSGGFVKK